MDHSRMMFQNQRIRNYIRQRRTGKKKLCKADLEGPAFNLVKAFHKNSVFLQYQMDECHKLLTNKVDLSNPEGDKEQRIALSISKLKAARYLDFGLEELVPSLWVESEREYDISAVYGITHWWFRRKEFYINKHKKDFKNLHPNDFEDLFLLNIQEKLNHLPKTDKTSLHTAVNMWIRNLVIRNRVGDLQLGIESYQTKINLDSSKIGMQPTLLSKKDYTIVPKPVAVVAVSSSLRLLEPKRTIESRAKRSSINLVRTQHPSETMVVHNEDGNPARANIKQALDILKMDDGDGNFTASEISSG
ncbi:hypothetical protein Tco_0326761 [Tanacetum coccineum]